MAWLDIPAHLQAERAYLAKSGTLPAGFRQHALAPATHNLRAAALTSFYDWVISEYSYREDAIVGFSMDNPLKDRQRPLSHFQLAKRPDGPLPRSDHSEPEPSRPFRRRRSET